MEIIKLEKMSIKKHPEIDEKRVQKIIADDPSILGLGDIVLKDKERNQPRAGRLDLLLQDAESSRRYEVEIQLGATDESHIIRTIEYWDIERKRYPQYEHTAVLIAEDITSRFLNVVGLFNGMIPLVSIQMNAVKIDDKIGLLFTKVIDQMPLGLLDEDEETQDVTDRAYWENKASKKTVEMADELLELAKAYNPLLELKYNKFYIGLSENGKPKNFIIFRPKKEFISIEPRLKESSEATERLENFGLNVMNYDNNWERYRVRLKLGEVEKYKEALAEVIKEAFEEAS